MRYVVLAAVAATLASTPAMAEDFAGPYVGLGITLDNVQTSGDDEGFGVSGVGGTVFAGYDIPIGSIAFASVEANFDASTANDDEWSYKRGWGVSGRLGAKINDSTGLYARVGYSKLRESYESEGSYWYEGVKYGLGIQTGLTNSVSLRAELNQINYNYSLINNQAQLSLSYGF